MDPTFGYLHQAGRATRFAHPDGTSITFFDSSLTARLDTGPQRFWPEQVPCGRPARTRAPVPAEQARVHRGRPRLRRGRGGHRPDRSALRSHPAERDAPGRRELADLVREVLLADEAEATGLVELARMLGAAPAHLSRTFRHHVGMTVSR